MMVMQTTMVSPTETLISTSMSTITTTCADISITGTTETMLISIKVYTKAGEQVELVTHQDGIPNLYSLSHFLNIFLKKEVNVVYLSLASANKVPKSSKAIQPLATSISNSIHCSSLNPITSPFLCMAHTFITFSSLHSLRII